MNRARKLAHAFGPAMHRPKGIDIWRAGLGAGLGLFVTGAVLWFLGQGQGKTLLSHTFLIAPFGATTFLIFAVPSSPMAQPWSSVVGNGAAALVAVALLQCGLPQLAAAAIAVTLGILAMAALRAMHPPGGAVALATVLAASPDHLPGLTYVFSSVVLGTSCLVLAGIGWNHATGRKYPFRQPAEAPHPHGTSDATPERRLAPSPEVLASALDRLRLSANLGVEDLARLIDIAEAKSAAQNAGPMTAERMMSHDLITVSPHTLLPDLAREFRIHRFKSLPIRHPDGSYGGLVPQSALIGRSDADVTAEMLADPNLSTARRGTNLGEMMQLLADGHQQSVPVVENGQLVGLVTRSDLIAILASHLRQS
ncbi:MAG: HPP family protein [Cypionkella sp.]